MIMARSYRYALVAILMLVAYAASLHVFAPEIPHGNLTMVTSSWLAITMGALWIHDTSFRKVKGMGQGQGLDYIKEQIGFWRTVTWGLLASAITLAVTVPKEMHVFNETFLKDRGQLFLVNNYSSVQTAIVLLYMFVGPIYESAQKYRAAVNLLVPPNTEVPTDVPF
jgi:hypothetical protein